MKKSTVLTSLLAVICMLCMTLSVSGLSVKQAKAEETQLPAEVSLLDLEWENAISGYGEVHKNADWAGTASATVNGTALTLPFIGTHLPADNANPAVIVYDISEYSNNYEYFEASVAMINDGDNMSRFTVLADEKIVDTVIWRKSANATLDSHTFSYEPAVMKAYVKGAQKLTLKLENCGYGMACGSSAWINPVLKNYDIGQDRVYASDILDRVNNSNQTGWDYGYGTTVMYDAKADGDPLYFAGTTQSFTHGLGLQLKGTNYSDYSADKTNEGQYVSTKWNIEGKGFTLFNMLVEADLGYGSYVDALIDGEEVYHSPLLRSNGTLAHDGEWLAYAPTTINVEIPQGAKTFELRLLCENTIGDGLINYLDPAFYRGNDYLYTMNANETYAQIWPFNLVRGRDYLGRTATMHDSETGKTVEYDNGICMAAGDDEHLDACYSVSLDGKNYNYFSSKIGLAALFNGEVEENLEGNVVFYADVVYADGSKETFKSENITWANSGKEFAFTFDNKNAKSLNLYIHADSAAFSESVWGNSKLEEKLIAVFTADGYKKVVAYNDGDKLTSPDDAEIRGYDLVGWKLEGQDEAFDFTDATITEDMRFTAILEAKTFGITYTQMLGNDESATEYEPTSYVYGESVSLPQARQITGYTFDGWYLNGEKVAEVSSPYGNIKLTAKYTVNTYTVTFVDGENKVEKTVNYNGTVDALQPETKLHYTFDGWYSGKEKFDFANAKITQDVTLTAKWIADVYDVKYYNDLDGKETEAQGYTHTKHTYGVETALETAPEIEGYIFDGFYVDGVKVTSLGATAYVGEIKIVAKYISIKYTISFVVDGEEVYSIQVKKGETLTLPEDPVKAGFKFAGWFDGDTQVTAETVINGNLTLQAKFDEVKTKGCASALDSLMVSLLLCIGALLYRRR